MNGYRLSIDYGTTNTVACLQAPGGDTEILLFDGEPMLPSAVYAAAPGEVLTGRDAVRSAQLDPGRYEPNPKRRIRDGSHILLGGEEYPLVDLIAATLHRVVAAARAATGGAPMQVVMTHPAAWEERDRRAALQVMVAGAAAAGIQQPKLVSEPRAAAAYLLATGTAEILAGGILLVYDLGAGTCDIGAVMRVGTSFKPLAFAGLDIGGLDLDQVVVDIVGDIVKPQWPDEWDQLVRPNNTLERKHARLLRDDARTAKETLTDARTARFVVPLVGEDVKIERAAFDQRSRDQLMKTVARTSDVLDRAKAPVGTGIFLVGGATRTPQVGALLKQLSRGREPTRVDDPELIVAEGALHLVAMEANEPPRLTARARSRMSGEVPTLGAVPPRLPTTPIPVPPPAGPADTGRRTARERTAGEPARTLRERAQTGPEPIGVPGEPDTRILQANDGRDAVTVPHQAPGPSPHPPATPDRTRLVPNPQLHLPATLRAIGALVVGIALLALDRNLLLTVAGAALTLGAGLRLLFKAHDWIRCVQDTRPTIVDSAGILVSVSAPAEAFFPWTGIATVYLIRHRGSHWLVCTPASNSRLGGDNRTRKYWSQPHQVFLLTSVSGFGEQVVRDTLERFAGTRYRGQ